MSDCALFAWRPLLFVPSLPARIIRLEIERVVLLLPFGYTTFELAQVMQRISRSQLYQRELFQALRDGHAAVSLPFETERFSISCTWATRQAKAVLVARREALHPYCKSCWP